MMRIYCDSNIFRLLKERHPFHSPELKQTFEDLYNKVLFIYSEAHLDDLKNSTNREYLEEDLSLIEQYTKDNYFSYDHLREKRFQCLLAGAKEAFFSKDYEAARKSLEEPFNIDKIFDDLDEFPELSSLKGIMNAYMDLPISEIGPSVDLSQMDETSRKMFDRMLPGYRSDMTIRDFMHSMQLYAKDLLLDTKELTALRKYAAEYLKSENYSFEKLGHEFDQKFRETSFGKSFLETVDAALTENQKKDEWYRFSYAYGLLETYGITQERDNKNKLKKFTYDSLNRDAAHAYFASFCDYLVTDDKGLQVKASILFNLFSFTTKILSSKDFINTKTLLLSNEENLESFKTSLIYDFKYSFQVTDKTDIETSTNTKEFKTSHPYFNYFNRLQIITEEGESTYALFCRRHTQANFFMFREIELLVEKLLTIFGPDAYGRGVYRFEENDNYKQGETIREWNFNGLRFKLLLSYKTWGNFLVLAFDLS